jgi:hypothetical protein
MNGLLKTGYFKLARCVIASGLWRNMSASGKRLYPILGLSPDAGVDVVCKVARISRQTYQSGIKELERLQLVTRERRITALGGRQLIATLTTFDSSYIAIHRELLASWRVMSPAQVAVYIVLRYLGTKEREPAEYAKTSTALGVYSHVDSSRIHTFEELSREVACRRVYDNLEGITIRQLSDLAGVDVRSVKSALKELEAHKLLIHEAGAVGISGMILFASRLRLQTLAGSIVENSRICAS